ncbi:MAG: aminotransferase class V-fold PLP-dependent enzyme, partial [Anaerovoracaceae bacterium]
KYFGPHLGVMYCKKEVGEKLKSGRVMADDNTEMPVRLETGTPAMELHAAAAEAVEFIADVGAKHAEFFQKETSGLKDAYGNPASERRKNIVAGMLAIDEYEEGLAKQLREGLAAMSGIIVYGPKDGAERTSTVSFTIDGINCHKIAEVLSEKGIFVWDGDFYAIETIMNVLKLESIGGLLRIGLAPYNIQEEIDRVLDTVKSLIK